MGVPAARRRQAVSPAVILRSSCFWISSSTIEHWSVADGVSNPPPGELAIHTV